MVGDSETLWSDLGSTNMQGEEGDDQSARRRTFACAFCLKNIQSSELDDQSPWALFLRGDVVVAASRAEDPPSYCHNVVDVKIGWVPQCSRYWKQGKIGISAHKYGCKSPTLVETISVAMEVNYHVVAAVREGRGGDCHRVAAAWLMWLSL